MKKLLLFLCLASFINMNAQPAVKTKSTKNTVPANTTNKAVQAGSSFLYGLFSAPSGSNILLQNNGNMIYFRIPKVITPTRINIVRN